jgi:ubiquinone/menaquinone biosynthesis C-methylase UbiE
MMNHREKIHPPIKVGIKTGYYGLLAASYEEHRFSGALGRLKNWRDQRLVWRAVWHAGDIQRVLDMPCGTGRLLRSLARHIPHLVGADVSRDMIDFSRQHHTVKGQPVGVLEYVQCDAKHLPFHSDSFDLVVSGRFLHHLYHLPPAERVQVLREFARVSRRWVVGDFNIQYGLKYHINKVRSFLKGKQLKSQRMMAVKVFKELSEAGLQVEQVYPISWVASEKWYILCRKF